MSDKTDKPKVDIKAIKDKRDKQISSNQMVRK
jgi:hypothetical protein